MDASQLQVLMMSSSRPKVVLSASGVILAANEGSERLMALETHQGAPNPLINRSIYDIGIILIPGCKPVFRDLQAILQEASHKRLPSHSNVAAVQPSTDYDKRKSDSREPWDEETVAFWDEESKFNKDQELDVYVPQRAVHNDQNMPTTSMIRARLCAHAFEVHQQLYFVLTFSRPSTADLSYIPALQLKGIDERRVVNPTSQSGLGMEIVSKLIPHCSGITDPEGQLVYLTPSWYEFTGASEEQSLGTEWASKVHPEDREGMMASWTNTLKHGLEHWTYEARYQMHYGSYRWFLVSAQPLKGEDGKIVRWYASMLDVHQSVLERRKAERRQAILRLLAQADVSLWGVNQDHDIYIREGALSWSPPHNCSAHAPGLVADESTMAIQGDEDVERTIQDILDGKSTRATLEHCSQERWYRTRFVADCDPEVEELEGQPVAISVLGLTIDVTDVRARTMLQIENERLIANERAAKESTRLKSQFLANMSHEIRTPIAGIIGLGDLLSETILRPEQQELSNGIQQSAGFLLTLINDILDFSKIESGHMDIEAVSFQPSKLINDLRVLMSLQAKDKGIDLVCKNTLPGDVSVIGDPGRLRQVLTNLLSNSIKFTQNGSVTLSVTVVSNEASLGVKEPTCSYEPAQQPPNNGAERIVIQFVVQDTGTGISKEAMGRLFQPFSQADSSTARLHGGTGLGLSICRQLAELMGGHIDLVSELSVGTTATVYIPYQLFPARKVTLPSESADKCATELRQEMTRLRTGSIPSKRPYADAEMTPSPDMHGSSSTYLRPAIVAQDSSTDITLSAVERSSTHILVVEDNPVNQKIAMANIQKLGFSASAVWNGQEALTYLDPSTSPSNTVPSIILMDCMMPVMDGYQATQVIRHDISRFDPSLRAIPIVAMTASAIQGDREKCEKAGMDDYLTKPVNKETLEKVVQKWVVRRRKSLIEAESWHADSNQAGPPAA